MNKEGFVPTGEFSWKLLLLGMLAIHPLQAQQAQVSATVSVDFSKPISGVKHLTGFLHGIDAATPSNERILPLRPRSWRIGSLS